MNETREEPRRGRAARRILLGAVTLLALVVLTEGLLSLGSTVLHVSREARPVPAEMKHVAHDGVVGWTADGNLADEDAYGDWRPLTTTASGLRARHQPTEAKPPDGFRLLCAGGSATFGVGVGDDETWCRRLGARAPGLTAVNAGQPGHGPGQAWLYLRDRLNIEHDLLVMALDPASLDSLLSSAHQRFPKPRLESGESGPVVRNTPVPAGPFLMPWVTVNAELFSESHLVAPLLRRPEDPDVSMRALAASVLTGSVIQELQAFAESRDAKLVVVFFPARGVFGDAVRGWHRNLAQDLDFRGVPFIDLAEAAGQLPGELLQTLFSREGHLTPFGHQWAASLISGRLAAMEDLAGWPAQSQGPWRARYYGDAAYEDQAATSRHGLLSLDWSVGAPMPGLPTDGFSAIFDACLPLDEPGRFRVLLEADGQAQLSVNRQTVLDTGEGEGLQTRINTVDLPAGGNRVRVRYLDSAGRASVRLMVEEADGTVRVAGAPTFTAPGGRGCSSAPGGGAG